MSRWHKPDPPDVLWPPESPHWQERSGILAWRAYVACQKWRHGQPLSPQDVEGLDLSPDSFLLQPRQQVEVKIGIVTRCLLFLERRLLGYHERVAHRTHPLARADNAADAVVPDQSPDGTLGT